MGGRGRKARVGADIGALKHHNQWCSAGAAEDRGAAMRRIHRMGAGTVPLLLLGLVVAGCSSSKHTSKPPEQSTSASTSAPATSQPTGPGSSSPPTSASGAPGGPAQVDLTFSGAAVGHLDNPVKGPKYECGTPTYPDLWVLNDVEGTIGGTTYAVHIDVNNFTGQGKQTGNVVIDLTVVGQDPGSGYLSVQPPTVSFDSPTSGMVDGNAQQGLDSPAPVIHVAGTFHC